ncbi:carbohydrate ABC transporter permease [Paenibacillus dokdonensis]|uniref:Carbohydrate ABC transporter permease n=1 Tax=Paenibacillus dokdonensis TaxID=2567944 RepID=A0ABU6GPC8_9BACL|nr:carbohydrate ABC transporter permease [Paenibacillus dokdonensis]MEC0240972.1 carbohydrate ABC transporter permease [Paenibacillus dokdonensis]
MKKQHKTLSIVMLLVFLILAAVFMFPFIWMLSSSLKDKSQIFANPPIWIPHTLHWENFTQLFTERHFGAVILNSLFTAVTGTVGALFFCSLAGFAFAKYRFRGKGLLFGLVLASLMIPMESSLVPLFVIYRDLGLIDHLWGVILPRLTSAFGIFYMRQYCMSVENELLEAARMDGCSENRIYFRIVAPILIPAFASLGIIFFVEEWNNFLWPTVILRSENNLTIAVAIRALQSGVRTPYNLIMSGSVISVLPMLAVIFIFQKQIFAGLTDGTLKG